MKATKYINSILAATLMALPSCSERDDVAGVPGGGVALEVSAGIEGTETRAKDDKWKSGDCIGISGGDYFNKKYNCSDAESGTFSLDSGEATGIFVDYQATNYSAYYPYNDNAGTNTTIIANTADQNQSSNFDFLYATATASASNPKANFTFTHRMVKLILKFTVNDESGFTDGENSKDDKTAKLRTIRTAAICQLTAKYNGTFNTKTGEAVATGTAEQKQFTSSGRTHQDTYDSPYDTSIEYTSIIFPQTGFTVSVTINGQTYTHTFTTELKSGNSYSYNIYVKKTGLEASTCNIAQWTPQSGSGTAEYTDPFNGHKEQAVLICEKKNGKKLYFADRNIGANSPEDPGLYFWWGDVKGYSANESPSIFTSNNDESSLTHNKNIEELYNAGILTSNDQTVATLSPEYDAASVQWGGVWRFPTKEDFEDLANNCQTWTVETRTTKSGTEQKVMVYTLKNNNTIILPFAGYVNEKLINLNSHAYYWCGNTRRTDDATMCEILYRMSSTSSTYPPRPTTNAAIQRYYGLPIRPVIVK